MAETQEARTKALILVLGHTVLSNGKVAWAVYPVTQDQFVEGQLPSNYALEAKLYKEKVRKHLRVPGNVYEVELDAEGSMYASTARYLGAWKGQEERLAIAARHTARERQHKAAKALAAQGAENPLRTAMEPLRRAYRAAPGFTKAQLLAEMVEYITRP